MPEFANPDLPAQLQRALEEAGSTPRLLVTSDYDGTLAPIVSDPRAARPHPEAAQLLGELAELPETSAALISGRARADLAELSGVAQGVHLVGSHGAEFSAGFAQPLDDDARTLLAKLQSTLDELVSGRTGVGLESKPASIAVHVRNATAEVGAEVLDEVRQGPARWDGVEVTEGKAVIELAVIDTDKGSAIEVLREQEDATAVVFFGDDVTDEKAFRRLGGSDVGVKVGTGESAAAYRVESTEDVVSALRVLLAHRRRKVAQLGESGRP